MEYGTETDQTHTDTPIYIRNTLCKSKITHMETSLHSTDTVSHTQSAITSQVVKNRP